VHSVTGATDEFFRAVEVETLSKDLLISVATGLIGAIKLRRFVGQSRCSALVAAVAAAEMNSFDKARYHVPTYNLGPIINHYLPHGQLTEDYWNQLAIAETFWREHSALDMRMLCRERISDIWQLPIATAKAHNRDLYWGIIRENGRGAPLHWDDASHEFPIDFLSPRPVVQLSFNLYLSMPKNGGQTYIWPRRWQPGDEAYRIGSCWPDLPLQDEPLIIHPEPGDAIIFDPRNYHSVSPARTGRRFVLGFYLAITAEGSLITWS
jgi:hypothetical protein